jgi:VWFA-related protein
LATIVLAAAAAIAAQSPPQTFRGSVDLIAVDVQVIDRDGRPVAGLAPDKFDVTINGRKRRVVSADLIVASGAVRPPSGSAGAPVTADAPAVAPPGRVVILAIDGTSFNSAAARGAMVAARTFVQRLPEDDLVGLFSYPLGPKIDPTTDRAAVVRALDTVAGQRDTGVEGEFHLGPSEVVDLSAWADALPGYGEDLALKICGEDLSDEAVVNCRGRLRISVKSTALAYEGEGFASLSMLRSLLHNLGTVPGRKTVVLVSAGTIASDIPGGRPDLGDVGLQVGKAAAESNVAIYTLFIDQGWLEQYSAETRRPSVSVGNTARNSAIMGRWLDLFSGSAGGAMMKVLVGNGEYAYDRLLTELSAYYLLGVEPAEADRDGRAHAIKVKVAQRDATVHARSWVLVPTRNATPVAVTPSAAPALSAPGISLGAAPPHPLSAPLQPLATAFERADYAGMHRAFATTDLANVIADFRASDDPWPAAPRRTAVFALELAFAGLASTNGFARDQGIKLLAQYLTLIRQPAPADPFECTWYWAAVAGLEGLRLPDTAIVRVKRMAR